MPARQAEPGPLPAVNAPDNPARTRARRSQKSDQDHVGSRYKHLYKTGGSPYLGSHPLLLATGVLLNSGVGVAAGFVIGRQRARQQVVIHGLGDAAVRAAIGGVTPALPGQQPGVGKLLVQGL